MPEVTTMPVSDADKIKVAQDLAASNLFKPKTYYLTIGDEPGVAAGVLSLKAILKPDEYTNIKRYLTMMPRSFLWDFFMKKVWPGLPSTYPDGSLPMFGPRFVTSMYGDSHQFKPNEKMVWAAFIDLFNEANLEYINEKKLEPWSWEQEKLNAYYVSQSQQGIKDLTDQLDQYMNVTLALDPQAKAIMEDYVKLPPLGDKGLEISRQNALKELLKKKEYATAKAVVDAYRYISETELGPILTQPVPYDIAANDGSLIVKASK